MRSNLDYYNLRPTYDTVANTYYEETSVVSPVGQQVIENSTLRPPSRPPPPIPVLDGLFYPKDSMSRKYKKRKDSYNLYDEIVGIYRREEDERDVQASRFVVPEREIALETQTSPLIKKYDLLFDQPRSRNVRFGASLWLIWSVVLSLSLIAFITLLVLRQFDDPILTVAKNSAAVSLVALLLLSFTIDRIHSNKETWLLHLHRTLAFTLFIYALVHIIAHILLLINAIMSSSSSSMTTDLQQFLLDRTIFYSTGVIMIAALIVILIFARRRVRKHDYNVFYYTHILGVLVFIVFAIVHSPFYLAILIYPLTVIYVPRLLRLAFVRARIKAVNFGRDYAMIDLTVSYNWFSKFIMLSSMLRAMSDVWLVSSTLGRFERHPFTVIYTRRLTSTVCIKILVWRFGDWKGKLVKTLRENQNLNLYNYGIRIAIDEFRTSDLMCKAALKSSNVLFVLENSGISSFLSYAYYLIETTKLHDRSRRIMLCYRTDDIGILSELTLAVNALRDLNFVLLTTQVFTSVPCVFCDEDTIVSTRLDYRRAMRSFFVVTDDGSNVVLTQTLRDGSVYLYSNDESMRDRVVRQSKRWLKLGYYDGLEDDIVRLNKNRKINILL